MIYPILNLDSGQYLYFQASTPMEAMRKLRYYLKLSKKTKTPIYSTPRCLCLEFNGETYAVKR